MANLVRTKTTYKTVVNATKALEVALGKGGLTLAEARYVIAVSEDGRFAPVLVGNEYIPFAVQCNGITVVS